MMSRGAVSRTVAGSAAFLVSMLATAPAHAADGAALFSANCAACHQPGGVGSAGLAPPLVSRHIAAAAAKNQLYVPLVILNGLSGQLALDDGTSIASLMPPIGLYLSDEELAALVGYIFALNGAEVALDPKTISDLRPKPHGAKELRAVRESLLP